MTLDEIRERWLSERPLYDQLGQDVKARLSRALSRRGVKGFQVDYRAKSVASLLKKVIRKKLDYDHIGDKLGIRVVAQFDGQLSLVEECLKDVIRLTDREDTGDRLLAHESGYLSVHYTGQVTTPGDVLSDTERTIIFEVQVRTLCQDVWARMAHSLVYKPASELPPALARRVFSLGALLEVCDREFEDLYEKVSGTPGGSNEDVLAELEECFYRFTYGDYDRDLSLEVLTLLAPLLSELVNPSSMISDWVADRTEAFENLYAQYSEARDRWVFLFQPEAILLFYLLETDAVTLCSKWVERFPFEELQGLGDIWGVSVDFGG